MRIYSGAGVNDVYATLINDCMEAGADVPILRKGAAANMTKEIHPAIITLDDPTARLVTSYGRPVNVAFALAEVLWILNGREDVGMLAAYNSQISNYSDDGVVFNAAYGARLRRSHHVDQLEDIIATLRNDPSSRQAVMAIWHPAKDKGWLTTLEGEFVRLSGDHEFGPIPRQTKDRACNLLSHAMIRDGKLDWLQVQRSNDALWGTPYNWIQWTYVMEFVAQQVGVRLGQFVHFANSLHVYEHQFEEARTIEPFDIYHWMGEHDSTGFSDQAALEAVLPVEMNIRDGGNFGKGPLPTLWQTACCLWMAHRLYKAKNDIATYSVMMEGHDRVYVAAQLRFYWHWRWHTGRSTVSETIRENIMRDFPPEVAAWIQGDLLPDG